MKVALKRAIQLPAFLIATLILGTVSSIAEARAATRSESLCPVLSSVVQTGDVVFIEIDNFFLTRVARILGGWANHLGIVIGDKDEAFTVAESTIPVSRTSALCKFLKRSTNGLVAIRRYAGPIGPEEYARIKAEALARVGVLYDLKFNFDTKRQYCSKFVHEIFKSALNVELGIIETLGELHERAKASPTYDDDVTFWKIYFTGEIPDDQRIITPESLYRDDQLITVFDNSREMSARRLR
ncbi:MAG TPA: YiiX/YebB-like N1pC/P60 family cysteine hydrolase [Bdellovibrionota bacterium]|nr:YiiX/YebB-like N1pC/P60 family cysteine hydrolase [Bdellovibrionota bacterium]